MKIAFGLEYDGTHFSGWQRQAHGRTVQQCVEEALSRVANTAITTHCAGRTDAGVHASAQVVHVETNAPRAPHAWVFGANANLPKDISVLWACPVAEAFHARFAARSRTYRYVICCRDVRPGLWANKVSFIHRTIDPDVMSRAAQCLLGEHDFASFQAAGCAAAHAVRRIDRIDVKHAGAFITVTIEANAFVQHMVRNIIGTLLPIADGRKPTDWIQEVLNARDRRTAGITASAHGLYLIGVDYPPHYGLPTAAPGATPWSLGPAERA